ncbi:MAG: helix-turn-helix transcriptional regulator [Solirubrobacteraceae bacterium]
MLGGLGGGGAAPAVLPVPDDLRKLTAAQFGRLPADTREMVLLASVVSDPDGRSVDLSKLGPAEDASIVAVDDSGRIRFAHPLFASAAYGSVSVSRRRALHRRAAQLVADPEQRARHLALACDRADAAVASQLDQAAGLAASRGAANAAAELAELAARLTPAEDAVAAKERLLAAARFQFDAGDLARAEELAQRVHEDAPSDRLSAQALALRAHLQGRRNNFTQASEFAKRALALAGGDQRLQAAIELELAYCVSGGGDLAAGTEYAIAAADHAEAAGDDAALASALACRVMTRFIAGGGLDEDMLARALCLQDPVELPVVIRPRYLDGVLRLWSGDLRGSLEGLGALLDETIERGQEGAAPMLLLYMVQARVWTGELDEAGRLAERAREAAGLLDDPTASAIALGAAALVHAHQGLDSTRAEAFEALGLFERLQWRAGAIWPIWALGLFELSDGKPAAADRVLGSLAEQVLGIGAADPSFVVFLPDEIEALVELGELERAGTLLDLFDRCARGRDRDWATAVAERCRGLLDGAPGREREALSAFGRALAAHDRTEMGFERARTLLLAGQAHRRFKRRGRARELLEEALAAFDRIGAPRWSEKARAGLARLGPPGHERDELTETERRVAELAAAGLSNRQVADRAYLSVKTVEANLTRAYRKLGVRSRVGLANELRGQGHAESAAPAIESSPLPSDQP